MPVNIKDLDFNKITFSNDVKRDSKGNRVFINYEGRPLEIQLPWLLVPFGAGDYENNGNFVVNFSFGMEEERNESTQVMYEKMKKLDEFIIDNLVKNKDSWIFAKGKKNRDLIEDHYKNRLVREAKDPSKYAPTFVAKLPRNDKGEFYVTVWGNGGKDDVINVNGNPTTDIKQAIPKMCKARAFIRMNSMWCGQNSASVGRSVKLIQIRKEASTSDLVFDDDEDDVKEVEKKESYQEDSENEFLSDDDDNDATVPDNKDESDNESVSNEDTKDEVDVESEEEEDYKEAKKKAPAKKAPVKKVATKAPAKKPTKKTTKEALDDL